MLGMLLIGSSVLKARFRHDCRCCSLRGEGGGEGGRRGVEGAGTGEKEVRRPCSDTIEGAAACRGEE